MFARAYQFIQNLSLDIVSGAMILLHFFCLKLKVNPSWEIYVLLGAAVWFIYTLDHLDDAQKAKIGDRNRYSFHSKYPNQIKVAMGLVAFLCIYCVFQIPMIVLLFGVVFVILSFIYLLSHRKISKFGLKEIYVAFIYTSGILLVPFVLSKQFLIFDFLILFLISYANLLIFSWFDFNQDKKDKFKSASVVWGKEKTEKVIFVILALGFALVISGIDKNFHFLYYLFVLVLYTWMILRPNKFQDHSLYRILGDGVFLLPILFGYLL